MQRWLNPLTLINLVGLFVLCFVFTLVIHPGLWVALANGYSEDYLFNLTTGQILGLVVITSIFAVLLFLGCVLLSCVVCHRIGNSLPRWLIVSICVASALILSAVGLALVPQLHYLYYRQIIPDLPAQWVPIGDLSRQKLVQYFLLTADGTTTDHAKGVTVWICASASAVIGFVRSKKNTI